MTDLKLQHAQVLQNLIPVLERRIENALEQSRFDEAEALYQEVKHHQETLAELETEGVPATRTRPSFGGAMMRAEGREKS